MVKLFVVLLFSMIASGACTEKIQSEEKIFMGDYTIRLNREKCLVTYSRKGKSNSGHMKLALAAPCFFMKEYNTDRIRSEYFSDNNTTVVIIAGTPVKNDPAFPISSKRDDCGSQIQAAVIKGNGKLELSKIQQGSVYCPGLGAPEPSYWLFGHE